MTHRVFKVYFVSILFIGILSFPFLNDHLNWVTDIPNFENRKLAQKPAMRLDMLDPYPAAFENYYNDTFALRSRIIRGFNLYNILVLKKSPYPKEVIIGKGNWLFLAGTSIDAYLGKDSLSAKELFTIKEEFERREKYLASRKCRFYIMITPGKASVYPENIPRRFRKLNQRTWGEQLIAYMNQNSGIEMIDLFRAFKSLKSKDPLYYHTDIHWNYLGAFDAANVAIQKMSRKIPGLNPLLLDDFRILKSPLGVGDIRRMVGNLDMYNDTEYELIPRAGFRAKDVPKHYPIPPGFFNPQDYECRRQIKGSHAPKLLIFSDSFGKNLFPFMAEHFSTTVKFFEGWTYILRKDVVEAEKPDVVLLMIQEPYIRNILDNLNK